MKVTFAPADTVYSNSLTTTTTNSITTPQEPEEDSVPRDALIVDKILKSMGVTEYEPRGVEQVLELIHRLE